jgi:hypothetical protein
MTRATIEVLPSPQVPSSTYHECGGMQRLTCSEPHKPRALEHGYTKRGWDMSKEPVLVMGTDKMITIHLFHTPITVIIPDQGK